MARVYKKKGYATTRGPDRLYETPASVALWQRFVKPFVQAFTLLSHESEFKNGPEYFFNIDARRIQWCSANTQFEMPGYQWVDQSHPFKFISGTGKRDVKPGDPLIVRTDNMKPDHNEIEYLEQVFVLSDAQLNFVREKLTVLA